MPEGKVKVELSGSVSICPVELSPEIVFDIPGLTLIPSRPMVLASNVCSKVGTVATVARNWRLKPSDFVAFAFVVQPEFNPEMIPLGRGLK